MTIHLYTYRFLLICFAVCGLFSLASIGYVAYAPLGEATASLAVGNAMVHASMKGLLFSLISASLLELIFHSRRSDKENTNTKN